MNFKVEFLDQSEKDNTLVSFANWKKVFQILVALVVFLLFAAKLIYLQVFNYKSFYVKAERNFEKQVYILPSRGLIYSSDNKKLVENKPYFSLSIDLTKLNKYKSYTKIEEFLSESEIKFLKESKVVLPNNFIESFEKELKFGKSYYVLESFFDKDKYISYKSKLSKLNINADSAMIVINSDSYREYIDPDSFSHVLGYTGLVSEADLKNDSWYTPNAYIGRTGLEMHYEKYLRGDKGIELVNYNSRSIIDSTKIISAPVSGNSLYTSVNYDLQKTAANALKEQIEKNEANGGAVIAQNPKTGEVLAIVSLPYFDNNKFSKGIDTKSFIDYLNNSNKPLFNRAISMAFPPASTFKIVMSSAALEEKSLDPNAVFNDTGVINIGSFSYKTWRDGGHGNITIKEAMQESSDTFYYVLGGGHPNYPNIKPLGPWKIYNWTKAFGIGNLLGIDLPQEFAGFVPDPKWKKEALNEDWYIGNTYHFSIGQGFLTATPLQINTMTSAVANKGKVYKPHLVNKIISSDGKNIINIEPELLAQLHLSENTLKVVEESLIMAVSPGGTAYPLFNYPVTIAGKTGTAEFGVVNEKGYYPTHAWFTAYAPVEDPQIVITVFVENGGGGSDVAVPVAKAVFDEFFNIDSTKIKPVAPVLRE